MGCCFSKPDDAQRHHQPEKTPLLDDNLSHKSHGKSKAFKSNKIKEVKSTSLKIESQPQSEGNEVTEIVISQTSIEVIHQAISEKILEIPKEEPKTVSEGVAVNTSVTETNSETTAPINEEPTLEEVRDEVNEEVKEEVKEEETNESNTNNESHTLKLEVPAVTEDSQEAVKENKENSDLPSPRESKPNGKKKNKRNKSRR